MKTADLIMNKPGIKAFLSQLLTQAEISQSTEIEVPYSLCKLLAQKKSDIKNLIDRLEKEGLLIIKGVLSIDKKRILPTNIFHSELSADLPVDTIETLRVEIDKKKIEDLILPKLDKKTPAIFTLEKNGKIHRTVDGHTESFQFKSDKGAYRIIKMLAQRRNEPLSSSEILEEIRDVIVDNKKDMNTRYIRDTILKIRKVMKKKFTGIDLDNFILPADENDGYVLNNNIKIKTPHS